MSNLSDTMRNAANALLLVAEEAEKTEKEISALWDLVGKHENFNLDLQSIFNKHYGGM